MIVLGPVQGAEIQPTGRVRVSLNCHGRGRGQRHRTVANVDHMQCFTGSAQAPADAVEDGRRDQPCSARFEGETVAEERPAPKSELLFRSRQVRCRHSLRLHSPLSEQQLGRCSLPNVTSGRRPRRPKLITATPGRRWIALRRGRSTRDSGVLGTWTRRQASSTARG